MPQKFFSRKNAYLTVFVLLLFALLAHPFYLKSGIYFIPEQFLEIIVMSALFGLMFFFISRFERELVKSRQNLDEALKYIGVVNVQIEQLTLASEEIRKYPQSHGDFKKVLRRLTEKAMGIANSPWVIFRIIERGNLRTVEEYGLARESRNAYNRKVSNKALVAGQNLADCQVVESPRGHEKIKAYCVMPVRALHPNQKYLLRAIVGELEMLYLIFSNQNYQIGDNSRGLPLLA